MQKPKIDEKLKLLTDFGEIPEGVLLKVMARGPFQEVSSAGLSIEMDQKLARRWKMSPSKPSTAK
jgi:hypothetical protein